MLLATFAAGAALLAVAPTATAGTLCVNSGSYLGGNAASTTPASAVPASSELVRFGVSNWLNGGGYILVDLPAGTVVPQTLVAADFRIQNLTAAYAGCATGTGSNGTPTAPSSLALAGSRLILEVASASTNSGAPTGTWVVTTSATYPASGSPIRHPDLCQGAGPFSVTLETQDTFNDNLDGPATTPTFPFGAPGSLDAGTSTVDASRLTVRNDGVDATRIRIRARDANGACLAGSVALSQVGGAATTLPSLPQAVVNGQSLALASASPGTTHATLQATFSGVPFGGRLTVVFGPEAWPLGDWPQQRNGADRTGNGLGKADFSTRTVTTVAFAGGNVVASPLLVDLNADGLLDLVAINSGAGAFDAQTVRAYHQQPGGAFAAAWSHAVGEGDAGATLTSGDIDQDGSPELVVHADDSNYGKLVVYRANGGVWATFGGSGSGTGTPFYYPGSGWTPVVADLIGGNPGLEVAILGGTSAAGGDNQVNRIVVYRLSGGTLVQDATYNLPQTGQTAQIQALVAAEVTSLHAGVELLVPNRQNLLLCSPTVGAIACTSYDAGSQIRGVSAADLDGDGDVDLALNVNTANTLVVARNDGGVLVMVPESGLGSAASSTAPTLGDADGDGDVEILQVQTNGNVAVRTFNGAAIASGGMDTTPASGSAGTGGGALLHAEGNGDGAKEFVVVHATGGTLSAYSTGDPPNQLWSQTVTVPRSPPAIGDTNNDCRPDILYGVAGAVAIVRGVTGTLPGAPSFNMGTDYTLPASWSTAAPSTAPGPGQQAKLAWNAPTTGNLPVVAYKVYRGASASFTANDASFVGIWPGGTTPTPAAPFTDDLSDNLRNGQAATEGYGTYHYKVAALSCMGESAPSEAFQVEVKLPKNPASPVASLTKGAQPAYAGAAPEVTVTWAAATTNSDNTAIAARPHGCGAVDTAAATDGYHVYRSTSPTGPWDATTRRTPAGAPQGGTTFVDTTAPVGATYHYHVRSVNCVGEESTGATAAGIAVLLPATPAAPTATAVAATQVDVSWTAPAPQAACNWIEGYRLHRSDNGGAYAPIAIGSAGVPASYVSGNAWTRADPPSGAGNPAPITFSDTSVAAGSTYRYKVAAVNCLGAGGQSPESALVQTNQAPTSVDDPTGSPATRYTANEDTALSVAAGCPGAAAERDLLCNDTDPEGDALTVDPASWVQPACASGCGTLSVSASGAFTFTPAANACGPLSFTYKARDAYASSAAAATAYLDILCVNDPPTASAASLSVAEDAAATLVAGMGGTDVEGAALRYCIVDAAQPAQGTLGGFALCSAAPASYPTSAATYTPDADYCGPDLFAYRTHDGTPDASGASPQATVTINVACVPDAPTATATSATLDEDTTSGAIDLAGTDADGDALAVCIAAVPALGTLASGPPACPGVSGNNQPTYTPAAHVCGSDAFHFRTWDGSAFSASATVTLSITCLPDDPTAAADAYTVAEDSLLTVAATCAPPGGVLCNDGDPDIGMPADAIAAQLGAGPTLTSPGGSFALAGDGSFTYQAGANACGTDAFTYRAADSTGRTSPLATATLTVACVNDAPVAAGDTFANVLSHDASGIAAPGVLANDADVDGPSLTAVPATPAVTCVPNPSPDLPPTVTVAADGSLSIDATSLPISYSGTCSFTYQATDGAATSAAATVQLQMVPMGAPFALDDPAACAATEDAAIACPTVLANEQAYTPSGCFGGSCATATAAVVAQPANAVVAMAADGTFTFTPDPDWHGVATFTYQFHQDDPGDAPDAGPIASNVATATVAVASVNDPPAALDKSPVCAMEDNLFQAAIGYLLAGATDNPGAPGESNAPLLVDTAPGTGPAHGTLTLRADGSFDYLPGTDYSGPDAFTYRIRDSGSPAAYSPYRTVTLCVTPVDDAPAVATNAGITVVEGSLGNAIGPSALSASDVDTPPSGRTYTLQSQAGASTVRLDGIPVATLGTFTQLDVDLGRVTFDHDGSEAASQAFTFMVSDGTSTTAPVAFTIAVSPVDDPPQLLLGGLPVPPGARLTVLEDIPLQFGAGQALTVLDADAEPGDLEVTMGLSGEGIMGYVAGPAFTQVTPAAPVAVTGNTLRGSAASWSAGLTSFAYSPPAQRCGPDLATITFTANDLGNTGAGGPLTHTVTLAVDVACVNDAPTVSAGPSLTLAEDAGPQSLAAWANDVRPGGGDDEDGQGLTAVLTPADPSLFAVPPALVLASAPCGADCPAYTGTLTFTPAANAVGSTSVTLCVEDTGGTDNGGVDRTAPCPTFTVTLLPVNDPPAFTPGPAIAIDQSDGPMALLAWASGLGPGGGADEAGQSLRFTVAADQPDLFAALPTLTPAAFTPGPWGAHGTLSFAPNPTRVGRTLVTACLQDDAAGLDTTCHAIQVTIRGPPTAAPDCYSAAGRLAVAAPGVAANDAAWDGSHPAVVLVSPPRHAARFHLLPDGAFEYDPAPGYQGPDSFLYAARDGGYQTGAVRVCIEVLAPSDPLASAPDAAFTWTPRTPSVGEPVTFRDASVDRDGTITDWSWDFGGAPVARGTSFTHTFAEAGSATVTLRVRDDHGLPGTAVRTITVQEALAAADAAPPPPPAPPPAAPPPPAPVPPAAPPPPMPPTAPPPAGGAGGGDGGSSGADGGGLDGPADTGPGNPGGGASDALDAETPGWAVPGVVWLGVGGALAAAVAGALVMVAVSRRQAAIGRKDGD